MLKGLSLVLFIGIQSILFSQDGLKTGTIKFSTLDVNFGTIKKNSNPYRELTITNVGGYPLLVTSCKATCGCTVPNCPLDPIMPNQSKPMRVRYNTGRVGPFKKQITVYSNDQKTPVSIIRIHGVVLEEEISQK